MAKWADPSERCRELARREREIYGQQELPDLLEHMATEADKLRAEAANIAAQRDEAIARAEVAEERLRAVGDALTHRNERCTRLQAELSRIRAADRNSITVRTTEAAKMRKGQAI